MFPGKLEVVLVLKPKSLAVLGDKLAQSHRAGNSKVFKLRVQDIRIAVANSVDGELISVATLPSHRRLDVFVELVEGALQPPPGIGPPSVRMAARSAWITTSAVAGTAQFIMATVNTQKAAGLLML